MQLLTFAGVLLLFSCSIKSKNNNSGLSQIRSVKIRQILPTVDSTGQILSIDTSTVQIYYHQNKMLYKIENRYADSSTKGYSSLKVRYSFFTSADSGRTGIFFPTEDINNGRVVSGNSVIGNQWFDIINLNQLFVDSYFSMIRSEKNTKNGDVYEYYQFRDKFDTSFKRTAQLHFKNKISDLYIKPTHKIDKQKNMQLIKFQLYTPKQYSKEMKEVITEYAVIYLIEEVQISKLEKRSISSFLNYQS